jgi:hypothetical protein
MIELYLLIKNKNSMTNQELPLPAEEPQVVGAITVEESRVLSAVDNPESDQNVADIYNQRFIGHALGEAGKAYALVTVQGEEGEPQGSHYMYLGKDDFGTILNSDSAKVLGLPEPEQSLSFIQGNLLPPAPKTQVEEVVQENDLDEHAKQYFDILTASEPNVQDALSDLSIAKEELPNPRLAKIFAPRLTRQEASAEQPKPDSSGEVERYTRIINGQAPLEKPETPQERSYREMTEPYVDVPSAEQINDSLTRMREAEHDPIIEAIITKHVGGGSRDASTVELMRTNADLRYELGSYLLRDKIPHMRINRSHDLSERVFYAGEKSPNHKGYNRLGKVRSDEYAVMIALSMMDGTYQKTGPADAIERKDGKVITGMHRAGAAAVLSRDSMSAKYIESTLDRDQK